MGLMMLKKMVLFFLIFSASLLSTSFAGRRLVNNLAKQVDAPHEGGSTIHERMLRVNTKDYGTYDPAPTFVKPPFKLIPN
ncbi:protein CASPARIAN STRIP INTEGRITY FACTOR 1-like [Actinidia eriantha]|uniref:protein CASPARIAN STRIP INTEGRITY FACTOR 1-like n=1 Tax=Actinidia eriantha TaxID=165200 RepID=UPI002583C856|nr:protein CASPARIAN STRIP INTEGRITY FACTOR 1-like [Actinidia eriantha]